MPERPFRFLADARDIATFAELRETVRRAEAIGIDTLVIPDHLIQQMAPVAAMTAIAAISDRLRMSAFVLNNDLRHPAVLAQELASLDVLSRGRLDIAIGAGWNRAGVRGDRPVVRSDAGPAGTPGRGDRGPEGLLRAGAVQLRRRALRHHATTTRIRSRSSSRIRPSSSEAAEGGP